MQTPWIPSRLAASLHRSTPHPPWYGSGSARSMARSNSQSRILCRKCWGVKWLKAENSSCVHLSYLDSTYPRVECWRCLWSQSLSRLQLVENEKKNKWNQGPSFPRTLAVMRNCSDIFWLIWVGWDMTSADTYPEKTAQRSHCKDIWIQLHALSPSCEPSLIRSR